VKGGESSRFYTTGAIREGKSTSRVGRGREFTANHGEWRDNDRDLRGRADLFRQSDTKRTDHGGQITRTKEGERWGPASFVSGNRKEHRRMGRSLEGGVGGKKNSQTCLRGKRGFKKGLSDAEEGD